LESVFVYSAILVTVECTCWFVLLFCVYSYSLGQFISSKVSRSGHGLRMIITWSHLKCKTYT